MSAMSQKRALWSWCLYDWANSAFALTVMAAFFPAFFNKFWCSGVDPAIITFRLGMGNAVAGMAAALLSPVLGALAGAGRAKKKYLVSFVFIGVTATAGLFFIAQGAWLTALIIYALAHTGFALANLFYDALLVDIAEPSQRDLVSSQGFALGYLGCGLLFGINILMVNKPSLFGLSGAPQAIRFTFLSAAAWWMLFSIPLILFVRQKRDAAQGPVVRLVRSGFANLGKTMRLIAHDTNVMLFLVAYWFYFDGVYTVVMMANNFGISLGLPIGTLMIALLSVQLVAFPSSIAFGYAAKKFGAKNIILFSIIVYIIITLGGSWVLRTGFHFLLFAALTGVVQGSIQALSRSLYTRLIPPDKESEYFGFYNMIGRFSVVLGPALVGFTNLVIHNFGLQSDTASRCGISSLALLFIIGGTLLLKVNVNTPHTSPFPSENR